MKVDKSNYNWNVAQLQSMIQKKTILFDHPCQRPSEQWTIKQKSELILSLFDMFIYPVVAFQYPDPENPKKNYYDVIDGQQRLTTIFQFLNDEFTLADLDTFIDSAGDEQNISGLKYSELPESVRQGINSYTFNFWGMKVLEGDEEEVAYEVFRRLNSGTPVSKQHLTLISIPPSVQHFAKETIDNHNLFTQVAKFSENQRKKSDPQMSILQTIMILSGLEYESLSARHIEEFFQNNQINQELLENVKQYFTILSDTFENQFNKFVQKIHIHSLCHLISKNMNQLDKVKDFILWYSENNKPADAYKNYCGAGNIKKEKTLSRLEGIEKEFKNWLKKQQSND